jgi:hypothetical protein
MLAVLRGGPFDGEQREYDRFYERLVMLEPEEPRSYFGPDEAPEPILPLPLVHYRIGRQLHQGVWEFEVV